MPTTVKAKYPVSVDYRCDKCNEGFMRSTGITLTMNPPLFPHKCSKCGHVENFHEVFPHIEYRDKVLEPINQPKEVRNV